ncbi:AMP-binding protein [Nocardioides antri]|uniref:Acyl-CoA synthetase n=1 Tax=Nocardioides antri TaxID=2607659 RepID=A0A5B1M546_9ACTN|nr:AMP-binding protein [Nocardioides antri]KAA1427901.1 AMP-binding protein [Nocardioides antri]
MNAQDPLAVPTLCAAFQKTAAAGGDQVALRTVGGAQEITWRQYADRVRRIATGLSSLGVRRGDAVGLMLVNRPEFNLCDTAALHLGATPFSIYNTSSPEQITYLFGNAGCRVVITEQAFVDRIRAAGADLDQLVVVDAEAGTGDTLTLADLEERSDDSFDFDAAWQAVGSDDVATLIYTSGTTGPPKGVELTHANLLAQLRMTTERLPIGPDDRCVSFLPSAHIADRWGTHYGAMTLGLQITTVPDPKAVIGALGDVKPTVWGAVPRVWEKLKAGLEVAGVKDPASMSAEERAGVLQFIGLDQVRWSVSGAAPIPADVLEYFGALGLPICELWGMSELSCCATINPIDDIRIGTVGTPLTGVELRLADDGELLVKAPTIMKGYRKEPQKTADTIDADGWLHTGDIATIDDDGYVTIVDRKKELIINSAGKNMSPANIEQALKSSSPLIGQAVTIGDGRPYNVALLVLDPDAAAAYAKEHDLPDPSAAALAKDEGVVAAVAAGVEAANQRLSRVEQIKSWTLLPVDWEPGGDELTPTMKLKRRPIAEKYAAEIDGLYAGQPG